MPDVPSFALVFGTKIATKLHAIYLSKYVEHQVESKLKLTR